MYEAVKDFVDLMDDNHIYHAGDKFPREGAEASKSRIAELASDKNRCGEVLIKAIENGENSPVSGGKEVVEETVARKKRSPKKAKKEQ